TAGVFLHAAESAERRGREHDPGGSPGRVGRGDFETGYRSRTRRGVQARETQIIMQSLAFLPSSSRTESRWSGTPSRTGVSQVPHVPSAQEDSTPTPASSTTDRMDLPGGTVRVSSL